MIISVASGKGGTGKTTVATSLALSVPENQVRFLDCDVEAPNAHLFLRPEFEEKKDVGLLIPVVDDEKCTACGICADVCQFHAIVVIAEKVLVFPELCHGCGSCTFNCPEDAIHEEPEILGILEGGKALNGIEFARGLLNVGEPMAVPVIRELKKWKSDQAPLEIRDVPPGTSCPVVEAIRGSDFVILVTEPTPFGLHDLKLAAQVVRELNIPAGVIINRDGIGDSKVDDFCMEVGIPILMRVPMDRQIAEALARGNSLIETFPEYSEKFQDLYYRITEITNAVQ